jgi:LmbE family N-acetylglucosaminyl deacetylase
MGEIMTLSDLRQRVVRRLLVGTADLAEPLWGIGFKLAGTWNNPQPSRWRSAGGKRVLVLAPHPDDEVCGCAGTIRQHKLAGDTVRVCVVTDGRLAASPMTQNELVEVRQQEAKRAAAVLDVDGLEWAGFAEGGLWVDGLVEMLRGMLETFRPEIIYTTSRVDFHPDHHRVALALARALAGSGLEPIIRLYQVHVPLTAVVVNVVVDVSGVESAVRQAVGCYASQWWHLGRTMRMRRYAARYYGGGKVCEVFWEMTVKEFLGLHGETAEFDREGRHWGLRDFRGMRFFSWRDPLVYWVGMGTWMGRSFG